jgi:hypothetical protein
MQEKTEGQKMDASLENLQQINSIAYIRNWAIEKIRAFYELGDDKNAMTIASEYDEWINISEDELEYLYMQDTNWSEEMEIDVM